MKSTISKILEENERRVIEIDQDHTRVEYVPRDKSDTGDDHQNTRRGFMTLIIGSIIGFFGISQ
ncbi:MAG: hypothetical protein AAF623_00130 [Planctomycetota bacterium]